MGPGLLESIYEKCFTKELSIRGINYQSQQSVPIFYKGMQLSAELRYDVLVENLIITELKSIEGIPPVHEAILLTYMKLLKNRKGF